MTIGERIKAARNNRNITQKELAKRLNVSETFISQYERGIRNPKIETLQKISNALEVPLEQLRSQEEKPKNEPQQLCAENENFIQNKFGYCFYSLGSFPLIYNLYVHPQYRRHGHSRELLELVISAIRKNGYNGEIRIEAKPREESIGLKELVEYYHSMGLAVIVESNNIILPPELSDPTFPKRMAEDEYWPVNMPNRPII